MSAQSVLLREQRLAYLSDAGTTPASVWVDVQRKRTLAASVQVGLIAMHHKCEEELHARISERERNQVPVPVCCSC